MDDLVTGTESVDEAFNVYLNCKHLMKEGGFNLRKWKRNSLILMKRIENCEGINEGHESVSTQATKSHTTPQVTAVDEGSKILGVYWDRTLL